MVSESPLAWAVQQNTPQLKSIINQFLRGHKIGKLFGNTITAKYLSHIKWVKGATEGRNLVHFKQMVSLFRRYGNENNFPYLLLAAQAFQESGLNSGLRSRAGAVGVMQIKPSTAAADPIDITGIERIDRNIEAGAKYLRYMVSLYYANEPMDQVTSNYLGNIYKYYLAYKMTTEQNARRQASRSASVPSPAK